MDLATLAFPFQQELKVSQPDQGCFLGWTIEDKISAQPHTSLCLQFLDKENNDAESKLSLF